MSQPTTVAMMYYVSDDGNKFLFSLCRFLGELPLQIMQRSRRIVPLRIYIKDSDLKFLNPLFGRTAFSTCTLRIR